MAYKFLEHTADIKFKAEGKTLEEAFIESALALKEVMIGDIKILPQAEKKIDIKGKDMESLLYNFLEEFIFLLDAEKFITFKISELKVNKEDFTLQASLIGDNSELYHFTSDVKAVTYNEMKIEFDEKAKTWEIQVVLDV
jgi:SHS2 domain-containing protein